MDFENIDFDKLRNDLINYFGSAMAFNPLAIADLSKVENATNDELIQIALKNNFNLDNYIKYSNSLKY